MRWECKSNDSGLIKSRGRDNSSKITILSSHIGASADAIVPSVPTLDLDCDSGCVITFADCIIPSWFEIMMRAPDVTSYALTQGSNTEVHFVRCRLPSSFYDNITYESGAKALIRCRDCHYGDTSDDGEMSVAFDCDIMGGGGDRPRLGNSRQVKSWEGFIKYWPTETIDRAGTNTATRFPPWAVIRRITLKKKAYGSSSANYRLAVINGDGTRFWGVTNSSQQRWELSADLTPNIRITTDADQTMRVVPTVGIAYENQTGNFAVGETITGGSSLATGIIISQYDGGATGSLIVWMQSGTFTNGEALTGSIVGAADITASGVSSYEGVAEYNAFGGDDMFLVEYV